MKSIAAGAVIVLVAFLLVWVWQRDRKMARWSHKDTAVAVVILPTAVIGILYLLF